MIIKQHIPDISIYVYIHTSSTLFKNFIPTILIIKYIDVVNNFSNQPYNIYLILYEKDD